MKRESPMAATPQRRARARRLALAALALTMPLLQTAGCADIATRSVVNGFFNGFNAWLAEALGNSSGL